MASPVTPARFKNIPDAIIEDCTEHWLICFKPDRRGVIVNGPQLVSKTELLDSHPHLVETWEAQREEERAGAQRIKRNIIKYAHMFGDDTQSLPAPEPPEEGVACDQRLLPGTLHSKEPFACAKAVALDINSKLRVRTTKAESQ
ncbi:hypothetical protein E8E13_007997 [Curvularia kusanoi]|uniref:Uncharacterized protein n=1 Tax=Curvularia kusanoi TaxID=90978 RepID=A0A9P4WD88_CURKU|nr:hypothetical protein E8E13_007997 [Curvularia kusanoi]